MEITNLIEFQVEFEDDIKQKIKELIGKIENYFSSNHELILEKCIVSLENITDKIQIHLVFEDDSREWNIFINKSSYKDKELPKIVRELNGKKLNSLFSQRKLEF